jgi:hypothetical protein
MKRTSYEVLHYDVFCSFLDWRKRWKYCEHMLLLRDAYSTYVRNTHRVSWLSRNLSAQLCKPAGISGC